MRSSHQHILDRWLRAERDDRGDEADAALLALLSTLPTLQPPAGFADRVMARAGLAAVAVATGARRSFFASAWVRALLTLCLLAIGVSALWLPQTLRAFAGLLSLADLVRMWSGSVVAACNWLASALGMWDFVLTVGRALATPLETPAVALAMVSCLLVSMVAFRFLRNLITRDRSWTHEFI
jgi:hypothetical protein